MPLPGTPHTAKISILYTLGAGGAECENVFYLRDSTDAMFANPDATCAAISTQVDSNLQPVSFAAQVFVGVGFEDVRTFPFGGLVRGRAPLPGALGAGTGTIPSSACIAVRKSTATLGRAGRGRWYWPLTDLSELTSSGDQVTGTRAGAIVTTLQAFQGSVESAVAGSEFGIVSYVSGGVQRGAGLFSRVTFWNVSDLNVDSQRRRLVGRGR